MTAIEKEPQVKGEADQQDLISLPESAITDLKKSVAEEVTLTLKEVFLHFEGPLPPPQLLQGYDDLIPNGAERIMVLLEQQARHRQEMEAAQIDAVIKDRREERVERRRGQFIAAFIGFFLVLLSAMAIAILKSNSSAWLSFAAVVCYISALALAHRSDRNRLRSHEEIPHESEPEEVRPGESGE